MKSFLSDDAKKRGADAVRAFEAKTSAELVLSVKKEASSYEAAKLISGSAFAFSALCLLLFHPYEFNTAWMPLDVALAFLLGWGLAHVVPNWKRLFVFSEARQEAVHKHAKSLFVDLGISNTTGRTGVLMLVSILEHAVEFVWDAGIPAETKEAVRAKKDALEEAVRADDLASFLKIVEGLGPVFGEKLPRQQDDVNELPDEVA